MYELSYYRAKMRYDSCGVRQSDLKKKLKISIFLAAIFSKKTWSTMRNEAGNEVYGRFSNTGEAPEPIPARDHKNRQNKVSFDGNVYFITSKGDIS